MAENKKSFILYCDLIHTVSKMPKEKAGDLFVHILNYVNDNNPVTDDLMIELCFEPIKQQLKRDLVKYTSLCEKNAKNGSKGGRPKKLKKAKKPTGLIVNPTKAKKADNDNDTDTDTDIIKKELQTSALWIENQARINKIELVKAKLKLKEFWLKLYEGTDIDKSLNDIKKHFAYWLPKNIEEKQVVPTFKYKKL